MSFWALVELPRLPRWSRGRVTLLGDAAHAPLPHQGQGAGLAIEDAYALGVFLAKGGLADYGSAFQAFEHLRKRRAWTVQAYSRVAGRAYKFTAAQQQPEMHAGRRCRSGLDGFIDIARKRCCRCPRQARLRPAYRSAPSLTRTPSLTARPGMSDPPPRVVLLGGGLCVRLPI